MVKCILEALTPEAEASMGSESMEITHFPFRVGRESRLSLINGELTVSERRRSDASASPSNDLYLLDHGHRLNVSRSHFHIDKTEDGYCIVDRESACGTIVGEMSIGGTDKGGKASLASGDVIVVGTSQSPFVFRFRIE